MKIKRDKQVKVLLKKFIKLKKIMIIITEGKEKILIVDRGRI